ncbi:MAG: radical SAM protein [archaeon]|nr:radical SAM protein [archaeon]
MSLMEKVLEHSSKTLKARGASGMANLVQQRMEFKNKNSIVSSTPNYIQIEPTLRCNLDCTFCSSDIRGRTDKNLSLEEFKKIVAQFPMLDSINLQGVGEPLLNPEFFDMIKFAKTKKIWVYSITNATFINEKMAQKIIDSGIDVLGISLDGVKKETYESARINGKFDQVVKNIKTMTDTLKKNNSKTPEILITVVAHTGNITELPDLIRLANELGVKKVNIQNMHYWGHNEILETIFSEDSLVTQKQPMQKTANDVFEECKTIGKELGVKVILPNEKECFFPWTTTYISVEGFVTPCCIGASDPRIINFGNILEKPFSEIWNSKRYQQFRNGLRDKEPHHICENCIYYKK